MTPSTDGMEELGVTSDMDTESLTNSLFTEPAPPAKLTASSSAIGAISAHDHSSPTEKNGNRYHPYGRPAAAQAAEDAGVPSSSYAPTPTASQENPMFHYVSDKLVTIDGSQSYLESNPLFDSMGVRRHRLFRVLICICGRAVLGDGAYGHVTGHGVNLSLAQSRELRNIVDSMDLIKIHKELDTPVNGGPPVELLKQVADGHCCNYCGYCVPSLKAMDNHWSRVHKKDRSVSHQHHYHRGTIQTFSILLLHITLKSIQTLVASPRTVSLPST
jgi:hypothetical protein